MFRTTVLALFVAVAGLPLASAAQSQTSGAPAATEEQKSSDDRETRTVIAEPVERPAAPADPDAEPVIVQTEVIDIGGKWEFIMYGSVWSVDLVREPTNNPNDPADAIYCGQAARERRDADSPVITRRLCAGVQNYTLYARIPGTACRATWRPMMQLDGRCGGGGMVSGGMDAPESTGGMFRATWLTKNPGTSTKAPSKAPAKK